MTQNYHQKKNVNRYFEKAKESKTQYHKAIELIENVSREKDRLIEFKDKTLNSSSIKELEQIAKGLKIKMKNRKEYSRIHFGKIQTLYSR